VVASAKWILSRAFKGVYHRNPGTFIIRDRKPHGQAGSSVRPAWAGTPVGYGHTWTAVTGTNLALLPAAFDHPLAVAEHDDAPTVTFIWVPARGPRR
jgi:hypothetical protein